MVSGKRRIAEYEYERTRSEDHYVFPLQELCGFIIIPKKAMSGTNVLYNISDEGVA